MKDDLRAEVKIPIEEGEEIELESGKNIVKIGEGYVETLPTAVRHSQTITVNGIAMETYRTELMVSGNKSRLIMYVKEA
jgi:hypothetical protein